MAGRGREELVFTAPMGGPVTDVMFRCRVWNPAMAAARLCGKKSAGPEDKIRPGTCGPVLCWIQGMASAPVASSPMPRKNSAVLLDTHPIQPQA